MPLGHLITKHAQIIAAILTILPSTSSFVHIYILDSKASAHYKPIYVIGKYVVVSHMDIFIYIQYT